MILDYSLVFRVTYTRYRIDTINSPDDGHMAARNVYRMEINIYEKMNCASSWLFTKFIRKWSCKDNLLQFHSRFVSVIKNFSRIISNIPWTISICTVREWSFSNRMSYFVFVSCAVFQSVLETTHVWRMDANAQERIRHVGFHVKSSRCIHLWRI